MRRRWLYLSNPQVRQRIFEIEGRAYTVELTGARSVDHEVAIVIPQHDQVWLTWLAVEAICRFTSDVRYRIWVVDQFSDRAQLDALQHELWPRRTIVKWLINHTPVPRWWRGETHRSTGSRGNGVALEIARRYFLTDDRPPRYLFAMHNDALPLRHGWLSYLMSQQRKVAGVKRSESTGAAHASGVLLEWRTTQDISLMPDMPHWDAGERPSMVFPPAWTAEWQTWRDGHRQCASGDSDAEPPAWLARWGYDISYDDKGNPIYLHLGGGTVDKRGDIESWVKTVSSALDL